MPTDSTIITELIKQGKKLEAIKLLRQSTGMDLKSAAEEVERISAASPGASMPVGMPHDSGFIPEEVRLLAREGKTIEAIKLLREQTGLGLKEAKEQVDGIAGIKREGSGCLGVVLLLVVGVAAAIAVV